MKVLAARLGHHFMLEMMPRLVKEHKWELCYCIDYPKYERDIIRQFPSCYFHSVYDAMKGVPHPAFRHLPPHPIGDEFHRKWPEFESMTIKMIDRLDLWSTFNYRELCNLFRGMVKYWSGILDLLQPDLVLFSVTPHTACDYVLYSLAHSRGIGVLFFRSTAIPGYIYPLSRTEDFAPFLSRYEYMVSNSPDEEELLPSALEEHVRRLSGHYSEAMPKILKDWRARSAWKSILNKVSKIRYVQRYPLYLAYLTQIFLNQRGYFYYKQRFRSYETSRMSHLEYGLNKFIARLKQWRLLSEYSRQSAIPDLDVPFVYVPLHYQPERTTLPEGGAFCDQRDVINVLASTIPDGWYLYVKEHPAQFVDSPHFEGHLGRDFGFYSDLASYQNVRLVPVEYDSFRLTDAAKAVATTTGTAGWEAIVRGTPTLVFGHAWYRGCEGAFYVPSHELCKRAMEVIRSGYQVDQHKVRLWLRAMEESCVKACIDEGEMQACSYTREENAENLARAIADAYAGLHQRRA